MGGLITEISSAKDELVRLRRELHRFPELGFKEHNTAARVAGYMRALGIEVTEGVGGTGVIGLLRGTQPGPAIAIRACLDALPVTEKTGLAYASENEGVMHACGHDGNMVFALGAAKILSGKKELICGNVKFIFQPSEEETGGAAQIIKAGGLESPAVDAIITLHNWHGLRAGAFSVRHGPVLASSDVFKILVTGVPGHGGWPHLAVDPVAAAAEVVLSLQRIISREIDPLQPALISVGRICGGTAVNIIPETVEIDGTVRTYDPGVRDFIEKRITEISKSIAQAARAGCSIDYRRIMPPVSNDRELAKLTAEALVGAFGADMMENDFSAGMGCEEFALFAERIPGVFIFIGNGTDTPIHSPCYDFNDEIITAGVRALCEIALKYCARC